jgi:hypothetical protein
MQINHILTYVSILVIFLSFISLGLVLNGNAVGTLNITIYKFVNINFTTNLVNFGNGAIDSGKVNATIDTLGNVINGNWTPTNSGFILENIGNVDVSLDLKSGKTAIQFLGGTSPLYQYNFTDKAGKTGSCTNGTFPKGAWINVNTTNSGDRLCNPLRFSDSNNTIRIDLKLVIPADSLTGNLTDIFTAVATAV